MSGKGDTAHGDFPYGRAPAYFTLLLLLALYLCAMIDRVIVNILVAPIQREFGVGEFEMGLLLGPAFGVSYVLLAYPFAWLSDKWSRRGTVFLGIVFWSICNILAGFASTFGLLFAARVGTGAGEAALVPAAYVLISQIFPNRSLALALSVFSMGAVGGMAVSYGLGGWLLDVFSAGFAMPLIGHMEAWRLVFFVTGLPSLVLGMLLFAVPDPSAAAAKSARQTGAAMAGPDRISLWAHIRNHPWPLVAIPFAVGTASLSSAAITAWLPAYLMPAFGWSATRAGAVIGGLVLLTGIAGKVLSGVVVDKLFAGGMRDAHPRYLLFALLLAAPPVMLSFYLRDPVIAIGLLGLWFLLAYPVQGAGGAAIQLITPVELRGRVSAIFIVVANLMATAGPVFAGYFAQHGGGGAEDIAWGIVLTILVWAPVTMLLLARTLAPMRAAVEQTARLKAAAQSEQQTLQTS